MTEATLTAGQRARLLQSLPGLLSWKIADGFTAAIPDFAALWNGYTSWVEVKYIRRGKKLSRELRENQAVTLVRADRATKGRAWLLVFDESLDVLPGDEQGRRTLLYTPAEALQIVRTESVPLPPADRIARGFDYNLMAAFIAISHREGWHRW